MAFVPGDFLLHLAAGSLALQHKEGKRERARKRYSINIAISDIANSLFSRRDNYSD